MKNYPFDFTKMMFRLLSFVFVLWISFDLAIPTYQAQGDPSTGFQEIDAFIKAEMQKAHIPGLALAIVQGDQVVHQQGFGIANPSGLPVTPQTPFLIGSVSKSFTSLAVLQLVEAGKVDLDASVQRYLTWFRTADPAASAQITVRHLLNQTSGFPENAGQRTLADGYSRDDALEREVRSYQDVKLSEPVGSRMQYSNANHNTLGMVIQAVSGMKYEDYIQEHIFVPLNMQESFTSRREAEQHGLATGYRKWFGFPIPADNLPYPRGHLPSGYLISSAEDLGHYLIAQLDDGYYQGQAVLSPEGIGILHQPARVEPIPYFFKSVGCDNRPGAYYAMGWWSLELNQIPVICHSGDTPDFHADVVLTQEGQWGVVLLTNVSNKLMSEDIHGLISGVVSLLTGKTPVREPVDLFSRVSYFFLVGVLGFEIAITIRAVLQLRAQPSRHAPGSTGKQPGWFQTSRPLLFSMLGAGVLFFGVPLLMGYPIKLMLLNQPDFTGMLIALGVLIMLRGGLRSWINLREIRNYVFS